MKPCIKFVFPGHSIHVFNQGSSYVNHALVNKINTELNYDTIGLEFHLLFQWHDERKFTHYLVKYNLECKSDIQLRKS